MIDQIRQHPFLRNVGLTIGGRIADILAPLTDKQELDNYADKNHQNQPPKVPFQSLTIIQPSLENFIKEDPNNSRELINNLSGRFRVGYSDTIGRRPTMEDQIVILGCFGGESNEDYFAVFDGHGGSTASKYCGQKLHEILHSQLTEKVITSEDLYHQIPSIMKESFISCNHSLKPLGCQETGTTAVVAYSKGNNLWIANTGDSRAVLCKNGSAIRVTTDHKPTLESERNRILELKGYVIFGRVNGVLAVSRALGDFYFNPHVTCEPDVFGPFDVYSGDYQFLILACDGLWDVVDDSKAIQIVLEAKSPEEGAKQLVTTALQCLSGDNISVIVIFFPNYKLNE